MNKSSGTAFDWRRLKEIRSYGRSYKLMIVFPLAVLSFSGLVIYDKIAKKKIIEKHCNRVKSLANEPMSPLDLPRKVKIYMSPFPGSDLHASRMQFQKYICPILQAGAVDYEIIEGNKEGDLKNYVSEEIRCLRRGELSIDPEMQKVMVNVRPSTEEDCAIIVGRQTLKEYLAGIHEGWLEPLESPHASSSSLEMLGNKSKDTSAAPLEKSLQSSLPADFSIPILQYIPLPCIFGFFNIPFKILQFSNRRYLAQIIASKIVDVVLVNETRYWDDSDILLGEEETCNWPKKYRKRTTAGVWTDDLALDKQIMSHVRLYCSS
ncbi:uncharacterized protein T551_01246 [Pneumocystis jirovecii RU7]|uniref:Mitochondrial import inner membrane translocase subunit TIM54 n=1 Tax=Pneumocystis jirovecii (strain RU7) TaxID=1408657 RepID=A0A0W4ZS52_PNEJ7|nr:uncharacterized protein T551_01246 [Pneumocystis jirovecii RU7]KTW31173.1 hypothetical protein T551_01246 [Pneumocystis jirovecii RU7]